MVKSCMKERHKGENFEENTGTHAGAPGVNHCPVSCVKFNRLTNHVHSPYVSVNGSQL